VEAYALEVPVAAFSSSRACFEAIVSWLDGAQSAGLTHAELEDRLQADGRRLLRQLLQDHLDLRAQREPKLAGVVDADQVTHHTVEAGRARTLATVFGDVRVERLAYRARGQADLHPADAALNLPQERHSHGLRRLAAVEASRGSFAEAAGAVDQVTGQRLGNRQVEQLAQRAAVDFDDFYATRSQPPCQAGDVLVLSCDGKGIVMRPQALRPATAKAATSRKLATRLSKGEQRHRKRLAELGCVYDCAPAPRAPADILPAPGQPHPPGRAGPRARGKWLTASVTSDAVKVIGQIFDEAARRDPDQHRTWVVLVDGNNHQLDRVRAEARSRGVKVAIVVDFVHVLEYVWRAAWCFFAEGDPAAETWVRTHALRILNGRPSHAAAAIRRKATRAGLTDTQRRTADTCANYLLNKKPYLDYPTALARGWPISTGVIEGACRHLVKDRMDRTGARWGLAGAEAILKLRALRANGDFDTYWAYHLAQERQRVHAARYATGIPPDDRP
jgi:hypothetical protein